MYERSYMLKGVFLINVMNLVIPTLDKFKVNTAYHKCTVKSCYSNHVCFILLSVVFIMKNEKENKVLLQFAQHQYILFLVSYSIYPPHCLLNRLLPRITDHELMHKYK